MIPVVWPAPPHGFCACGMELHYTDKEARIAVEHFIRERGENVTVTVGLRHWLVPRHYIALHGLKAQELPQLGFLEIGPEELMARE